MLNLKPKEIPTKVEQVVIKKLDNGYCVEADTKLSGKVSHYCSNLKGVTKALWLWFEGKEKLNKDQVRGVKQVLVTVKEGLERQKEEQTETENA